MEITLINITSHCLLSSSQEPSKCLLTVKKNIRFDAVNQIIFRPCSGIVISGYSKTLSDKSLITHLAKAIIPYEKFRKMYKVDSEGNIGEFRGKH